MPITPEMYDEAPLIEEYVHDLGMRPCRRLIGEGDEMREETDEEFRKRLLEMYR